ncbi:TraB family protein [Aphelenchoides avenae]|nr:TraB family protein [Aphelenchus avenae]
MWPRFRRENVLQTLAKSPRYHSSAADALEPFDTLDSSQKRKRPDDIAETREQPSRNDSSAEDALERFSASNSAQKLNASTDTCLTNSRLEVLNVTFGAKFMPENDGEVDRYEEFFRQGQVFLIGTTHGDKDCAADVRRAIRRIRPDTVVVELCASREWNLHVDDAGSEFRAARLECDNLPDCPIVLGDLDCRITEKRASAIRFGEIYSIAKDIAWPLLAAVPPWLLALCGRASHNDEAKQRAFKVALRKTSEEVFLEWYKAYIDDRGLYMTNVLHEHLESLALKRFDAAWLKNSADLLHDLEPVRIVAIVGKVHVDRIKSLWPTRYHPDLIEGLSRVPRSTWIPLMANALLLLAIVAIAFTLYTAVF